MAILDARVAGSHDGGPCFPLSHRAYRAAWTLTWLVFAAWTPPPFRRWRVLLLNLFGADIDSSCHVYGSTRIWYPRRLRMARLASLGPRVDCYCIDQVTLGEKALVSQGATLCTGAHDASDPHFQLFARPISIEADAWIAAEAFVGPGVSVGRGAVLGARSVAFKDLEPWMIYVGNPCKALKPRVVRNSDLR